LLRGRRPGQPGEGLLHLRRQRGGPGRGRRERRQRADQRGAAHRRARHGGGDQDRRL
ncbi:MAG: Phosphate ABC transporter, periplasmic phosphate-binding protein PstS, partial [uncultured Solirubrobacteraceae bacterium]